jgi:hypothetical protein
MAVRQQPVEFASIVVNNFISHSCPHETKAVALRFLCSALLHKSSYIYYVNFLSKGTVLRPVNTAMSTLSENLCLKGLPMRF